MKTDELFISNDLGGTNADKMKTAPEKRLSNLDLVRVVAILMVVIYHSVQFTPNLPQYFRTFWRFGAHGVDVFFSLSGFLIGGLYWNEFSRFGNVETGRFIGRRILRTIPPYLLGLMASYLAVAVVRHEPFDFGYLVMVQNYHEKIPYFLVSWSLCVEEHFYLCLPFLLLLIRGATARLLVTILLLLSALPTLFRFALGDSDPTRPFGFATTATHFRFEGLLLGVLASYIATFYGHKVLSLLKFKVPLYGVTALIFVSVPFVNPFISYNIGLGLMGLLSSMCILLLSKDTSYEISKKIITRKIAELSYSMYLVHALVLNTGALLTAKLHIGSPFLVLPLLLLSSIVASGFFYKYVEKPCIAFRDRYVPRRSAEITAVYSPHVSNKSVNTELNLKQ